VIGISISGTDAGNYTANSTASTTADISARDLAVTAAADNKVYDGNDTAVAHLSDDRVSGDVFTGSYTDASFVDKNVGTGKVVSVIGISISGTDAGNYTANSTASTTADISARPITVTADTQTKVYGAIDPALTYKITSGSLAYADTFSGALIRTAGETVGGSPYAIKQGTLSLSNNYSLTYVGSNLTISQASTTTAVTSSVSPSTLNQPVIFTATISPQVAGMPTGTVIFKDGGVTLGTGTLNGSGIATFTTSSLAVNAHSITAVYSGDANFTGSTSSILTQKVWYRFDGFLQPINDTAHTTYCGAPCVASIFKGGSTIPVKFQLKDFNGKVVQSINIPKWLTPVQGGATSLSIDESVYSDPATPGTAYNWDGSQYHYNWGTKGFKTLFYWRIGVQLDDGQTYYVYIGLR
jgi:hypothetical protein